MPAPSINPASYWEMEEASSPRLDQVAGLSLTTHGTFTDPGRAAGIHNFAGDFNGTTNGLWTAYNPEFACGVGVPFTVTGWFYLNPGFNADNHTIIGKGAIGGFNPSWYVFHRFDGLDSRLSFVTQTADGDRTVGDVTVTGGGVFRPVASTWYFFAAGVDNDGRQWIQVQCNARTYMHNPGEHLWIKQYDGSVPIGTFTLGDMSVGCSFNESAGGAGSQSQQFPGRIDELAYYPGALTDEDLSLLCPGLFYPFGTLATFEIYLGGEYSGQLYADGVYGEPTVLTTHDPTSGQTIILDLPIADLAGWLSGRTGQVKIRRRGGEGNTYTGDIVLSAIELYGRAK